MTSRNSRGVNIGESTIQKAVHWKGEISNAAATPFYHGPQPFRGSALRHIMDRESLRF
ncbi:MAG TPA: hypothetical protein VN633_19985 [Bryobacteraceae bacterium]|nr:hypothetical protein [Bryobacteraceae bacterium]